VYYGPDTYMGRNLATLLGALTRLPDEQARAPAPCQAQQQRRVGPGL